MLLPDLDDDLILSIADLLARLADSASLAAASRRMHGLVRKGVERGLASHRASLMGLTEAISNDASATIKMALRDNAVLTKVDLSSKSIGWTGYIKASEVEGESKEVGARVMYRGREMVVCEGVDSDGELELSDVTGVLAIADALKVNGVLNTINLARNDIGDEGAAAIAEALRGNGVLTTLVLEDNNIGAEGAAAIAEALRGNGVLTKLNLDGHELDLPKLRGTDSVTSLDLSCKGQGLEVASAIVIASLIAGNGVLTTLNLNSNDICDTDCGLGDGDYNASGIVALADALKANRVLTNLNLNMTNIRAEGATAIAVALCGNAVLKALDLGWNDIKAEGVAAIAEALRSNGVLKSLNLDYNEIDAEGTAVIAEALRGNAELTSLNLSYNEICNLHPDCTPIGVYDASGIVALADALKVNRVLQSLDIRETHICDEGASAIAEALRGNGVLTSLNLQSNYIRDEGAAAIAQALRGNGVLTELQLGANEIRDEGAKALASALRVNGVLTNLDLSGNNIGGETDYIKASEVEGESKQVGAMVMYEGREMVVSQGVDPDGDLKLRDTAGVHAIAEYVTGSAVLKSLDVRCNKISGDAAQPLATAVLASPSLEVFGSVPLKELRANTLDKLALSGKRVGVPEALVLAKLVEGSGVLAKLDLDGHELDLPKLRGTDPVTSLDLSGKGLGPASAIVIASLIAGNGVLTTLDLEYNNLGDEGKGAIRDAVNGREGFELKM